MSRKSSGKPDYRRIAAELEIQIRRGEFPSRLSTTRELQQIFQASKQTLTKALVPFREEGVITDHGRKGISVHKEKLQGKLIGIVEGWLSDRQKETFSDCVRQVLTDMEKCGFQPVILQLSDTGLNSLKTDIFPHFDGLICLSWGFTEKLAVKLKAEKVPFVSVKRLPWYDEIDYVKYDTPSALNQLLDDVLKAGYRNPALLFPAKGEGFNELICAAWKRMKRKAGLAILPCDRICHRCSLTWLENAKNFFGSIEKMEQKPDVLIHYGALSCKQYECYKAEFPEYPFGMKVVRPDSRYEPDCQVPEDTLFRSPEASEHFEAAFHLLVEKMRFPEAPPVRRLIPMPIEYIRNPLI